MRGLIYRGRAASDHAAVLFRSDHPFAVKRFETDGKSIFATLQELGVEGIQRPVLLQDLNLTQMVMDNIARPFFKNRICRVRTTAILAKWIGIPHRY